MKRISILLLVVGLMLLLVGCGGKDGASNTYEQNDSVTEVENSDLGGEAIEVDKHLFSVEVTIPASFFGDDDLEQIKTEAEQEEGIKEVTINSDGSITYKMTKATHSKMMDDIKKEIENTIQEIKSSGDYPSIIDIKVESYKEFTMVVDREKFENSFDAIATLGLGMGSMFYQAFDGVESEAMKVTIHVEDSNTSEVFKTIVYPDDLK